MTVWRNGSPDGRRPGPADRTLPLPTSLLHCPERGLSPPTEATRHGAQWDKTNPLMQRAGLGQGQLGLVRSCPSGCNCFLCSPPKARFFTTQEPGPQVLLPSLGKRSCDSCLCNCFSFPSICQVEGREGKPHFVFMNVLLCRRLWVRIPRGLVGLQKGRGGAIGEGCARGTLLKGTLAGVGVRIGGKWNLKPTPGPSARPKALHGPRLPREGAAFQFTQRHGVGHLSAPERLSDPCPQPG